MKRCTQASILALSLLAGNAHAQSAGSTAREAGNGGCPGMGTMGNQMQGMMDDIDHMTQDAKDPALKQKLANMHERMATMMVSMRRPGNSMMGIGNGMMGGSMMSGGMTGQPGAPQPQDRKSDTTQKGGSSPSAK